ncbi:MAG: hypothetical protein KatS3mg077_0790 [Candidatus Binatia bacterium]|nr:MAG: hypothetical protein KatS3mg077_0790 [Candidatus Binatia bacterium]
MMWSKHLCRWGALGLLAAMVGLAPPAPAQLAGFDPAPLVGRPVRLDGLVDEKGEVFIATPESADAGPLLLAPIYARCPHTCSPLAANLLRAIGDAGARLGNCRVAILSFDPRETAENLRRFRERVGLPDHWALLRAQDVGQLREILQQLRFVAVERGEGQFDHPNVVYVISPEGVVTDVLPGLSLSGEDLVAAVNRARAGGVAWWHRYLLAFAALGLAGSAFVFFATWIGRVRRAQVARQPHARTL